MKCELEDIQGLVAMGYKTLRAASYLLLEIKDASLAQTYMRYLLEKDLITRADKDAIPHKVGKKIMQAMHLAFTSTGLKKIGLEDDILKGFSREFTEGMHDSFRAEKILGDVRDTKPDNWKWGNSKSPVDMILLCYAETQPQLDDLIAEQISIIKNKGIEIVSVRDTYSKWADTDKNPVEHFGFHDGISSPMIEGITKPKDNYISAGDPMPLKAGEFVLGYPNEYGVLPDSPGIPKSLDPENLLSAKSEQDGVKDLGKNGTYLVFREITQDVFKFWNYMKANSREKGITPEEKAIALASKMVGRWPGGAPLVLSENADDPEKANANSFRYYKEDPNGYKCPFGAHIRRACPRDQLHSGRSQEQSEQMSRKHRILRRGRIFGKPLVESMKPQDMLQVSKDDGGYRGIHFICLVANIRRQFEFIQNVWANNFTFADLCNEVDPLISPRPSDKEPLCNEFTVQDKDLRRNYREVPQFTKVVGGAYFFMPGIQALKFLANYRAVSESNPA